MNALNIYAEGLNQDLYDDELLEHIELISLCVLEDSEFNSVIDAQEIIDNNARQIIESAAKTFNILLRPYDITINVRRA